MGWSNDLAYAVWKATLKGDEGTCVQWRSFRENMNDRGGLTHWGVTRATWIAKARQYGWNTSEDAQCSMTDKQFNRIVRDYWESSNAPRIKHPGVAIVAAALYWGTGRAYPIQHALRALGKKVSTDGIIGNETVTAINSTNGTSLMRAIEPEYYRYFRNLAFTKSDPKGEFQEGWRNRITRTLALAYDAESNAQAFRYGMKELKVPGFDAPQKKTDWQSVFLGLALVVGGGYLGYRFYKKKRQRSGQKRNQTARPPGSSI